MEHRARSDVICLLQAGRPPGNWHTFHRRRKQEMNREACAALGGISAAVSVVLSVVPMNPTLLLRRTAVTTYTDRELREATILEITQCDWVWFLRTVQFAYSRYLSLSLLCLHRENDKRWGGALTAIRKVWFLLLSVLCGPATWNSLPSDLHYYVQQVSASAGEPARRAASSAASCCPRRWRNFLNSRVWNKVTDGSVFTFWLSRILYDTTRQCMTGRSKRVCQKSVGSVQQLRQTLWQTAECRHKRTPVEPWTWPIERCPIIFILNFNLSINATRRLAGVDPTELACCWSVSRQQFMSRDDVTDGYSRLHQLLPRAMPWLLWLLMRWARCQVNH